MWVFRCSFNFQTLKTHRNTDFQTLKTHRNTDYIRMASRQCESLYIAVNILTEKNETEHWLLLNGFSSLWVNRCVFKLLTEKRQLHTDYISKASHHCDFLDVEIDLLTLKKHQNTDNIWMASHNCESFNIAVKIRTEKNAAEHWLLLNGFSPLWVNRCVLNSWLRKGSSILTIC